MDQSISEVIIVLDKAFEDRMNEAVEQLRGAGVHIDTTDDDSSVVEGEIDTGRLADLKKLPCVDYVRTVFSYFANFPPGDPRDRDGR